MTGAPEPGPRVDGPFDYAGEAHAAASVLQRAWLRREQWKHEVARTLQALVRYAHSATAAAALLL